MSDNMKFKITVITNNGRRHVEEVDAAIVTSIPLPATPIAAITGASHPATQQFSNPITLPSGTVGDVYMIEPLHYNITHLNDESPIHRTYSP